MSAALDLSPEQRLAAHLLPLLHHVRRDPRLAHLTIGVGEDAALRFDLEGDGVRLAVGGVSVSRISDARAAMSLTVQEFLFDGWAHANLGAWARAVGADSLRRIVAGL